MKVVIVRYNAGNVLSVSNALKRLGVDPRVTDDEEELRGADRVIFPGVGEAQSAMTYLKDRKLDRLLSSLTQPVLGICLGMQLLCRHSEENDTQCLGLLNESVKLIEGDVKVPHMGWNRIHNLKGRLFQGVPEESYVYFVHSYAVEIGPDTVAECNYGGVFAAGLVRDNFSAVQFHPEKSGSVGETILHNFLKYD